MSSSSGKLVAKKIALFELNPPASLLPFGSNNQKFSSNTYSKNISTNTGSLLNRKDAIKRKKYKNSLDESSSMPLPPPSSSPPMSNCSSSSYSEDYGLTTNSSTASSCYSSGGGSDLVNIQLYDEYILNNEIRSSRKQAEEEIEESDHQQKQQQQQQLMLYNNSIESDYLSSSNYDNEHGEEFQQQQNRNTLSSRGTDQVDYYKGSTNLIRTKEPLTLTRATIIEKNNDKKCGSNLTQSNNKVVVNNNNRSTSTLGRNRKTLKDCYDSFSLPIVSGQNHFQPLRLVEFSDIRLDSDDDHVDADDEAEHDEKQELQLDTELEMEPFYEELDDYDNNGKDNNKSKAYSVDLEDYPRMTSFLWDKVLAERNEVENSSTTPTSTAINLLPPTTTTSGEEMELIYSEPVYNEMGNGSLGSSGNSTNWTPTSSLYNRSKSNLQQQQHFSLPPINSLLDDNHKSEPIYNYNVNSKAAIAAANKVRNVLTKTQSNSSSSQSQYGTTACTTTNSMSAMNDIKTSSETQTYYDITSQELPPIPNGSSTKFSTIAKSAGKKLAKKFQYIRKLSKVSLDNFELPSNLSLLNQNAASSNQKNAQASNGSTYETNDNLSLNGSSNGSYSQYGSVTNYNQPKQIRTRSQSSGNISCNGILTTPKDQQTQLPPIPNSGIMKRSVSRPNIPPPAPPPSIPLPNLPSSASNKENIKHLNFGNVQAQVHHNNHYNGVGDGGDEDDDDFDDSDFYDSDSELIRNFVAAVQPIYSMEEEPLYQYYTYGISLQPEDDYQPIIPKNLGLTLDMLVPRTGQRTLWCELPEVIASGILTILSDKQKQLQEAIFEILTSEVSYLKSLDVLITLFYENDQLIQLLTEEDRTLLFGNITFVKDCAQSFLTELLTKWEESWYIQDVGQVIHEHANTKFGVYKDYCRNKPYQDKALQRLRSTNDEFVNVIKTIEENPKCQLLRMDSFLMLPMQRITRLPLLVNAIIQRVPSPKEKVHCEDALKSLTNLVIECNEAARESQDEEETASILEKMEFPKHIKSISCPGKFILKGDFMRNPFDNSKGVSAKINWTFQKNKRVIYWLILFTNHLIVAKKKSADKYEVLDLVSPKDTHIKPLPNLEGISKDFQHFFMLHFDRKETVYFLSARAQSEVERWKQKIEQIKNTKELKVEAIFPYEAKRPDELSFEVGEIILVEQMQPDGWYYGTKGDRNGGNGISGWFPGNYCAEC